MTKVTLSASELKRHIEIKAFAYGVSETVSTLIGEYVVDLLRSQKQKASNT